MFFVRHLLMAPLFLFILLCSQVYGATKIVIAENGAGIGLIEHTLPAITLAATRNVDYLELHVVMTADDELLVYRDLILNRLSNVAEVFPERNREDGNYYIIDFTLSEIRQLRLKNVLESGPFPLSSGIPTLKEELSLIRSLETMLNKQIGISLEIKNPLFHKNSGRDISDTTLDILSLFGYTSQKGKCYLQCYDSDELQRIYTELLPKKKMQLPLIQLVTENDEQETKQQHLLQTKTYNHDWLFTNIGLRMVASYATAIGLPSKAIVDQEGTLLHSQFIQEVHKYGLKVLVTSIKANEQFQPFAPNFPALLKFYYTQANIDGVYTDSFSEALQYNEQVSAEEKWKAELPTFFSSLELTRPTTAIKIQDSP